MRSSRFIGFRVVVGCMSEQIESVDVSGYKSASGAAKATAEKVREIAEMCGHNPEVEVLCEKRGDRWVVFYEAGPSAWATKLTGGRGVLGSEPEIQGLLDGAGFHVECEYSFALAFYSR